MSALALLVAVLLPAQFESGRAFAVPVSAVAHDRLVLWIDSDGSGFLTQAAVRRLRLATRAKMYGPHGTFARLPAFERSAWIPKPRAFAGDLRVIAPDASDPIFAGLDGQLGASWLQDRIWLFDYPAGQLQLLSFLPQHPDSMVIRLLFEHDDRGRKIDGREYPALNLVVDGRSLRAAFDTAATVALRPAVAASLRDGWADVRATSFVTQALAARWHAAHPGWRFVHEASVAQGVDLINVPEVDAGPVRFRNVWFSTRPGDDVFEGEAVSVKLGPSAFGKERVILDYIDEQAIIMPAAS